VEGDHRTHRADGAGFRYQALATHSMLADDMKRFACIVRRTVTQPIEHLPYIGSFKILIQERKKSRMGYFIFGKAHTGSLYGLLPSADIGQVVYYRTGSGQNCVLPFSMGRKTQHGIARILEHWRPCKCIRFSLLTGPSAAR